MTPWEVQHARAFAVVRRLSAKEIARLRAKVGAAISAGDFNLLRGFD